MIDDPHIEKKIKIDGQEIPVWFYGNPRNPPIIFIHGRFHGFSDYIGDLPPRYLKKKYFLIAFDLPGFGKSKQLHADNDEMINEVIHKFTKRKVVLFGTSYGGAVALKFVKQYPKKVDKLIIAATPLYPKIGLLSPLFRGKLQFVSDFAFLIKKNLAEIKIPSLLIYGTKDRRAPVWMGKALNKMLPNSKLIIIENRIHSWFLHRIDQSGILQEIEDFLSQPSS